MSTHLLSAMLADEDARDDALRRIRAAYDQAGGAHGTAARILGVGVTTLHEWRQRWPELETEVVASRAAAGYTRSGGRRAGR